MVLFLSLYTLVCGNFFFAREFFLQFLVLMCVPYHFPTVYCTYSTVVSTKKQRTRYGTVHEAPVELVPRPRSPPGGTVGVLILLPYSSAQLRTVL